MSKLPRTFPLLALAAAMIAGCATGRAGTAGYRSAGPSRTRNSADSAYSRDGEYRGGTIERNRYFDDRDADMRFARSRGGWADDPSAARGPAAGPASRTGAAERPPRDDREAEAGIRRKLGRTIPRIIWPGIPWRDAVEDIAEQSGIQIVANWPALESEGLGPDKKVRSEARDISAAEALDLVIDLVGVGDGPNSRAAYYVNGNVLVVTTAGRARDR
jgi:hypothetical protein